MSEILTPSGYVSLPQNVRKLAKQAFDADDKGEGSTNLGGWKDLQQSRSDAIEELITRNPGIASTLKNGKFDIDWGYRNLRGVTDADVAKALAVRAQDLRANSVIGQEAELLGIGRSVDGSGFKGEGYDTLTSDADLINMVAKKKKYEAEAPELKSRLTGVGGGHGTAELKALGDNPTLMQMQEALTKAERAWEVDERNDTSDTNILRAARAKDLLQATRANDLAQDTLAMKERGMRLNTDTARVKAANDKELAMYKIRAAEIEAQRARQDNAALRASDSEARQMQMQFEYARLAQQDRQARQDKKDRAMMMLLQGLGNLGAAFTI
tara:strand:- start:787 stop:1764 length:978 start_codon:yes stop_codon:yes gene_type:complete